MAVKKKSGSDVAVKGTGLQAIVLSDTYKNKFHPLTLEKPRCLLPLANTPLIEYTLEFLATTGVEEVYVASCNHSDQVEAYLKKSKWMGSSSPFLLRTIALSESLSVGDVLRHIDSKGFIKSDFLLISGDVVCNIDFNKVMTAHRERKNKDRNTIMTMVLREANALHRTRPRRNPGVFVLDSATDRCLRYESTAGRPVGKRGRSSILNDSAIKLDAELLSEVESGVVFRNDLIDCRIDICTIDVPALFTENFDYDDLRSDFVRGILTSDLLGKTIYAHIEQEKYGSRVQSMQTYDAISKDIIERFTYPITADGNLLEDQTYNYQKGHVYKEDGVVLAQSCVIEACTVIGANSYIGDGTQISHTTIGRNCRIGKNVQLHGVYIWDNVTIEDDVKMDSAVIADNVTIRQGCVVQPGAVLSFGVTISAGYIVPRNACLTLLADEGVECLDIIGEDGAGYLFEPSEEDYDEDEVSEEEDEYESDEPRKLTQQIDGLVYTMDSLDLSDGGYDEEDVAATGPGFGGAAKPSKPRRKHHRSMSMVSATTAGSDEEEGEDEFFREAVATIERSLREGHTQDTTLIELNTLRMTMNVTHNEYRRAVMHALVSYISRLVLSETLDMKAAVTKVFNDWKVVLSRIIFDDSDQVDLLLHLQKECCRLADQGKRLLFYGASTLYDIELIEEDNVYRWWADPESVSTGQMSEVRELTARWVEWLQNAEEEDEDDEDSD